MSKKNNKNRDRKTTTEAASSTSTQASSSDGGGSASVPRKRLTVPERLVAKAEHAYAVIKDVSDMATFYGVPVEVLSSLKNFMVDADGWRGEVKALVEGGWQPVVRGELKDLSTGDKVSIKVDAQRSYAFIPEGTGLAVGEVERSENNRIKRVLLVDERQFDLEGVPAGTPAVFGWAQLSHLERR